MIRIHAVLGGKNPHPQTFLVGGMATPLDLNSPQAINPERIGFLRERLRTMRTFVEQVYMPDVLAVAWAYPRVVEIGGDTRNFLAYGGYGGGAVGRDRRRYLFPRGIVRDLDLAQVHAGGRGARSPSRSRAPGTATRTATGRPASLQGRDRGRTTRAPSRRTNGCRPTRKYSWLKSPRYDGQAMEVGPLARALVAYAAGDGGGPAKPSTRGSK